MNIYNFIRSRDVADYCEEIGLPEILTMQCRIMLDNLLKNNLPINTHGCYIAEKLLAENRDKII